MGDTFGKDIFKGESMRGEILGKSILGLWKDTEIKAARKEAVCFAQPMTGRPICQEHKLQECGDGSCT